MYKMLRNYASIAILVLSVPAFADEVARITLDNGAKVKLNDDFTWEYIILESQSQPDTAVPVTLPATVGTAASTSAAATEVITPAVSAATTETLTSSAIAQSALLKSTAKSGVKVSFANSQWDDDGRLGLTFELSSNSPEHYVMIELEISLFADSGALIKKEDIKVWQAIFRMPDTYLRKGQTRDSRVFWIEGIDKSQWTKQLMSLKVGEMDSRM
ncbi:DUF3157 family protein [Shewanella fidelis]|uniref:DUF3157 family protein n=1 Tax=Shewanella fidelis TaxID=173509 RepID=A0AAW8NS60_9GAMM|nr:DUF3157 family protein [Shewanella fidelis]MDR8525772.1 DUF3157 family protein [Shewanella fidelis]MDW4812719.1 DUF3157 family protein [Shewanella fidelis]MDW4816467.1 DUF3157 family protein [Shewanella fidelis]MDW4820369.1 DUF3157 family protein [Shewanella fidelis]MDW4825183.1 DUF3157 family protein [Shewanella fidelis]